MKPKNILKNWATAAISMATIVLASSCNSIFEDSNCNTSNNLIKLTYDYNLKKADAFDSEVEYVTLLAFDSKTGKLARRIDATHSQLTSNNEIRLQVNPGSYDILVWAGEYPDHFDIATGETGVSTLEDFHCYLHRDANSMVDDRLNLFHGMKHVELPYATEGKPNRTTVNLKKNTNAVRIVLQHLSGDPVVADDFEFTITDGNGWLNHDNTIRDTSPITYRPHFTHSGSVDINTNPTRPPGATYSTTQALLPSRAVLGASLAEFAVSRLMMDNNPILTITNKKENRTVLQIPINEYALLVKGYEYADLSDQEYLDRQDQYNMTFFLDESGHWIKANIIINNWHIIRNEGPAS